MIESNNNIFDNMGFAEEEAKELQFRSFLMTIIIKYIKAEGLTQKEAARRLGVTQSRISNLVRGKIDLFSISMLLAMLERAGFRIYEKIQTNAQSLFVYRNIGKVVARKSH
jgi:predicted XRE-type DNA-binding protein